MSINKCFVISFQPAVVRRLGDADGGAVCDLFDGSTKSVVAASSADDEASAPVCDCDGDGVFETLLCAYGYDCDLCGDEDPVCCTRCLTCYCESPRHCRRGPTRLRVTICCSSAEAPGRRILLLDLE